MKITQIAQAFSTGKFEEIFDFIDENAVWNVIEENRFEGKKNILENCNQVANYFKSVTTKFNIAQIITEKNKVVVTGTAEFLRNNKRVSFISACDVYEFNNQNKIQEINSYCINAK